MGDGRALQRAARSRAGSPTPTRPTNGTVGLAAFERLLARVRPAVERRLVREWDDARRASRRYDRAVATMIDAARDLTMRGGKRFRAALVVCAYRGLSPRAPIGPAIDTAAALELVQTYLLTQDDWIDGDTRRRGGPAVHAALTTALGRGRSRAEAAHLGASSAILASDLTWGRALGILAALPLPAARVVTTIETLLRIHEDVVIGQQLDVMGRERDVEIVHELKTGSYTVRGPLLLGAAVAGGGPRFAKALDSYARPLGVAFQLRDDLLGTFGRRAETGKRAAGDLLAGRRSAVLAEAEGRLDATGRRAVERVRGRGSAPARDVAAAVRALATCGARAAVETRLAELCAAAEVAAASLPLAPSARLELAGAATMLRPSGWPTPSARRVLGRRKSGKRGGRP